MTFLLVFCGLFPMTRFLFTQSRSSSFFRLIVVRETENRQPPDFLFQTAESVPAETAVPVPVASAPAPSYKKPEPHPSCPACGTYRHGLNAPGSNSPVRHAPEPRRYAPDPPLDHRAWLLPRHG